MAFQRPRSQDKLQTRVKAFNVIKERSFSLGTFVLASGKTSDYYLDMKPTMMHPEGAHVLAELVLDRIEDMPVDFVGGLAMGAVPLIAPINMMSFLTPKPLPGFFVRKAIKDHGTRKLIEGLEPKELAGKNVVILDDVTTTGESAMIAVKAVKSVGANVLLVLSIVDREEGADVFFENAGVPFAWLFRTSDFKT